MEFQIIRRFYSEVQANIYYLRLKELGFQCFLSNENISTILPLSDGGVMLHVLKDQLDEANQVLINLDQEVDSIPELNDYRDVTLEDIDYLKKVHEYNQKLENPAINMVKITWVLGVAFAVIILIVVLNYFYLNK